MLRSKRTARATALLSVLAGALLLGAAAMTRAEGEPSQSATYSVHHTLTVKELPKGTKRVRIWFWVPQEDAAQSVLDFNVSEAPAGFSIHRDPAYGSRYLYAEVLDPTADSVAVATDFVARRSEIHGAAKTDSAAVISTDQQKTFADQLRKDVPYMEVDPQMKALADQICGGETRVVAQAHKLYDWVIDHAEHYSKGGTAPKSSQMGSATYCLTKGGGACTDMHALFITLARARNIPTRLFFGSRLQPQNEGKEVDPGYRCWVQFFAPGQGWVTCDLAAGDTVADKREFYFGNLDNRRVLFSEGRDLVLAPAQDGPKINLVIGAYVEVDGKPYTAWDRRMRYTEVK